MTRKFITQGTGFPKCFCCKRSLEIRYDNLEDYIYYDNHFYHKDCFMKSYEPNKICNFCKKHMVIGKEKDNFVFYNNKFYHKDCFEAWAHNTKKPSKIRLSALDMIDIYVQDANEQIDDILKENEKRDFSHILKKSIDDLKRKFDEMEVNDYIKEFYDIVSIPSNVWRRLDSIYKGTFQKFDGQIPPSHLLDMWKQKSNYLRKIHMVKFKTNPDIANIILYDLAILMSKYNDYLAWKRKQNYLESVSVLQKAVTNEKIVTSDMVSKKQNIVNKDKKKVNDNMSMLVDDIFDN